SPSPLTPPIVNTRWSAPVLGSRVWTSPVPRSRYQITPLGAKVNPDGPLSPVATALVLIVARWPTTAWDAVGATVRVARLAAATRPRVAVRIMRLPPRSTVGRWPR